jgi:hypothetical protein
VVARHLAQRPETTPAQALTMFWWADPDTRLQVLRRFAVDRAVLCDELADLFALAAKEDWADPETRKAIALLERRQRNRRAAARSPFGSLENAIAAGAPFQIGTIDTGPKAFLEQAKDLTCGEVVRRAIRQDIDTPALITIYQQLKAIDALANPAS